jgi:hypothetical protein
METLIKKLEKRAAYFQWLADGSRERCDWIWVIKFEQQHYAMLDAIEIVREYANEAAMEVAA